MSSPASDMPNGDPLADRRRPRHRIREVTDTSPWWPPLAIGLLCFWAPLPLGSAGPLASALLILLCALLTAGHLLTRPSAPPLSATPPLQAWLLALLLWLGLQLLPLPSALTTCVRPLLAEDFLARVDPGTPLSLAVNRAGALQQLTLWLAYAAVIWVCSRRLGTRRGVRTVALALAIAGTFQAGMALINRPMSGPGGGYLALRLSGTFPGSNALGGYLLTTVLTTLGLLLEHVRRGPRRRDRAPAVPPPVLTLLGTAALLAQVAALLLTGSRGAMLAGALGVGLLLAWFFSRQTSPPLLTRWRTALAIGAATLVVLVAGAGVLLRASARLMTLTLQALPEAAASRLAIWRASWQLFLHHPFGVGLGGYADAILRVHPTGFGEHRVYQAHNDWLQALVELGLPGFLLLIGLLLALARRLRPLLASREGSSIWLQRGLLVGWLATLLHALVEFNLSARPGVALTACVLLGALLARAGQADTADTLPTTAAPARRRGAVTALAATAALLLVGRACWLAYTAHTVEQAFIAAGGEPTPTHWPRTAPGSADVAWTRATRAINRGPLDARTAYTYALTHVHRFESQRDLALQAPPQAWLTPAQWQRAAHLALREAETRHCRDIAAWIDLAVARAPWNADARALQGRVLLTLALTDGPGGSEAAIRAFRALDAAAHLAPQDPTVLRHLCMTTAAALVAAPGSARARYAAVRLRQWSLAYCAQPELDYAAIYAAWTLAGWPLRGLAGHASVDFDCLRGLYTHVDRAGQGRLAFELAERMAQHLHSTTAQAPQTHAHWVTREHAKWSLRLGHWSHYHDQTPARQHAFAARVERQLGATRDRTVSPSIERLALSQCARTLGLDVPSRLRLAQLETDFGDADLATDILATLALDPAPLPSPATTAVGLGVGRDLIAIREAAAAGRHADAARDLQTLLARGAIPHRLLHQARLLLARQHLALRQDQPAHDILAQEAARYPTAPEPLRLLRDAADPHQSVTQHGQPVPLMDALTALTPDFRLDVQYLGGAATLHGIALRAPATTARADKAPRLVLHWRFSHRVPADLAVQVRLLRPNGSIAWSRAQTFTASALTLFGAGAPVVGPLIPLEFTLPAGASDGAMPRLQLVLTTASGAPRFATDEGLSTIEIDRWQARLRRTPTPPCFH